MTGAERQAVQALVSTASAILKRLEIEREEAGPEAVFICAGMIEPLRRDTSDVRACLRLKDKLPPANPLHGTRGDAMTRHTPEPWNNDGHPWDILAGNRTMPVATVHVEVDGGDEAKANSRRIVACVNGCKGINPVAVPELLEALRELAEDVHTLLSRQHAGLTIQPRAGVDPFSITNKAQAAIAEAEVTP